MEFWEKELEAGPFLMGMLKNGLRLSFDRSYIPDEYCERNNLSARNDMEFVRTEVAHLVEKGCIVETFQKPKICLLYTSDAADE